MEYLEMFVIFSSSIFAIIICIGMGAFIVSSVVDTYKIVKNPEVSIKDKMSEVISIALMLLYIATCICALILIVNRF